MEFTYRPRDKDGLRSRLDVTKVILDPSVFVLLDMAFAEMPNLIEVESNEGLVEIREYGFRVCSKIREVIIPSNCRFIGWSAFCRCSALERITINDRTGNRAFWDAPI